MLSIAPFWGGGGGQRINSFIRMEIILYTSFHLNSFHSGYQFITIILANSEDPNEMPHQAVCKDENSLQRLKCLIILKFLSVTPLNTKRAIPYLLYQHVWENPSE